MNRKRTIRADGTSPLTRYVGLLQDATYHVPRWVDRDIEAIAILSEPALKIACDRAGKRQHRRSLAERTGRIRLTPRVWTQLDVIQYNARRPGREFRHSRRRTHRLVSWFVREEQELFPALIEESRNYGMLPVLGTEYRDCHRLIEKVLNEAISLSSAWPRADKTQARLDWNERLRNIDRFCINWMDYLKRAKPSSTGTQNESTKTQEVEPSTEENAKTLDTKLDDEGKKYERLRLLTPELDVESMDWAPSKDGIQKIFGIDRETLAKYRDRSHRKYESADKSFGIDRDDRIYRRNPENSRVYYYVRDIK